MIIRWPGKYKAGLRLEAAGMAVPPGMQGRSLTSLLTGRTTRHRDSVYCEFFNSGFLYNPPPMALCVRTEGHKLSYYQSLNTGELYDLEKDPAETNNLWDSSSARALREEMMRLMLSRMVRTVDPIPERNCPW
jgi:hypothetical protein